MVHTCPDCDTTLSPDTATVTDGRGEELTETYAMHMLATDGEQMENMVIECDVCGWSVTRSVTIRSIN